MESQISQYGNSLAIRIPKPFAKDLGLNKGSAVDISVEDGKLVVQVLRKEEKITGASPKELLRFVGRLPKENFKEIKKIINQGCEQVHEADW